MTVKKVGMFEAKTNFSQLVAAVEKGQEILIANRGRVVAKIVGVRDDNDEQANKTQRAVASILTTRRRDICLTTSEIKEMIEFGRK